MTETKTPFTPPKVWLLETQVEAVVHDGGWYEYRVARGFFIAVIQCVRDTPSRGIKWYLKWRRDPMLGDAPGYIMTGYGGTEEHAAKEVTTAARKMWAEMKDLEDTPA